MSVAEKVALIISQAVAAQAEIAAMQASNDAAIKNGQYPYHSDWAFNQVIINRGLDKEAVLALFSSL